MIRFVPFLVLGLLVAGCGPGTPPPTANQGAPKASAEPVTETPKDDSGDSSVILKAPPTIEEEPKVVTEGAEGIKIDKNGFEITGDGAQIKADKDGLKIKAPDVDVQIGNVTVTEKDLGLPLYPGLTIKGGVKALADGKKLYVAEGTSKDDPLKIINYYRIEVVSPDYHKEGEKRMVKGHNEAGEEVEVQVWPEGKQHKVRLMTTKKG